MEGLPSLFSRDLMRALTSNVQEITVEVCFWVLTSLQISVPPGRGIRIDLFLR